jgi:hypothetical protein
VSVGRVFIPTSITRPTSGTQACDMTTRVSMSSRSKRSTPSNERHEPRPPAEEWQLRILLELHKEQPRPTIEQRRLLATQTGL